MGRVATDFAYLATIIAFILALRFLSHPTTARRGNWVGAVGMLIAVAVTFAQKQIDSWWEIVVGMVIGGVFGAVAARRVRMTAMPQMVALFNGVGGGAAALASLAEFHNRATDPGRPRGGKRDRARRRAAVADRGANGGRPPLRRPLRPADRRRRHAR